MDRSAIQRYDSNADVKTILGKQDDKLGGFYPAESLDWWRKIALARQEKPAGVTPATAGRFLNQVMNNAVPIPRPEGAPDNRQSVTDIGFPDAGREAAIAQVQMFEQAVQRGVSLGVSEGLQRAGAAGLLPDKLLTLREAREQTGLAESTIRELPHVQERAGSRRKWKMSVLQTQISAL